MSGLISALLLAATALLALPALVLWVQVIAARAPRASDALGTAQPAEVKDGDPPPQRPRVAVLVPAHNEAAGIAESLASVQCQLLPGDRLLVVADNCSDDTAAMSLIAGAEVIERHDPQHRGKGYALDFGVRHLEVDPPQVLVMLDADCYLAPGALDALVTRCAQSGRPVQSLNLMQVRSGSGLDLRFAEFAWRVKNQVRPLGACRLGGPCQLMGTGMAFPWSLIRGVPLASGLLVEDMQLGIDLALAGWAPLFVPQALVTSRFPDTAHAARAQRSRWEHGHLSVLIHGVPRLLAAGLANGDRQLLALGADLMVPPLALLLLLTLMLGALNLGAWLLLGAIVPLVTSLLALAMIISAVASAWRLFGAGTVSGGELLLAPLYALRKLPVYASFVLRRQTQWVRAKRDGE